MSVHKQPWYKFRVNHEYTSLNGTLVTMLDQALCPGRALVLAELIGAEEVRATTGCRILVRVFCPLRGTSTCQ